MLELEACPELLSATEQRLEDSQDNLRRSERKQAEKAEALRQQQLKVCSASAWMRFHKVKWWSPHVCERT